MINVRMRDKHRIDLAGVEWRILPVSLPQLF
jgi:hypothetical protein